MTAPSRSTDGPDRTAWPPLAGERAAAGEELLRWAARSDDTRPRLCVLRGGRGSGKSHLLTWFLAGSPAHRATTVHASVPADGLFAEAFSWELSRQLGYGPLPPRQLLTHVTADARPLLLLMPDLHRAGRGPADLPRATARHLVDEVVAPLLAMPHVRAAVEVGTGSLLDEVAAAQERQPLVVDLGDEPFPGAGTADTDVPAPFAALLDAVPRTPDGRPIWDQAPDASRQRVLDRALALPSNERERAVRGLVTDPGFLLHGSPVALAATLADERITVPPGLPEIWRRAAPQLTDTEHPAGERAALLHAAALGTSRALGEYLRPLAEKHHWTALWARHRSPVTALARVTPGDGAARLVIADPLGRLRLHDGATGARVGGLTAPPTVRPQHLAAHPAGPLLALDGGGDLHVLSAASPDAPAGDGTPGDLTAGDGTSGDGTAETVLKRLRDVHDRAARADDADRPTALGGCRDSAVVGDARGVVRLWSLSDGVADPPARRLHHAPLSAVTCLRVPRNGRTLVFSAGFDGCVRLWEVASDPLPEPVERRPALVTALGAALTPRGPVLAAAWSDLRLHLWQVDTGRLRVLPLLHPCDAVDLSEDGVLTVAGAQGMYAVRLRLSALWE